MPDVGTSCYLPNLVGLQLAQRNDLSAQLDLERACQRELCNTRDFAKGVRAFLEKRSPRFTGQ